MAAYEALLREQAGGCAICGRPPRTRRLNVDHDHRTGRIRGLLCYGCNYGLGVFRDDPARLRGAYEYLLRARRAPHNVGGLTPPSPPP